MTGGPRPGRRGAALRTGLLAAATVRLLVGGVVMPGPGDAPITAEVDAANHAPVATDDKASVDAGATIEDPAPGLLFNDVDADGDPLIAMGRARAAHGTAIVRRDGSWTYTPDPSFAGTDGFTYVVSDGLLTSGPATVLITVRGPAVAAAPSSSRPRPRPSPTSSPIATRSPTPVPADPALPPAGPGAAAFSIPEPPSSGAAADGIGLEASSVAGLGPVLWIVPSLLLAVPGLALVLVVRGRAARRSAQAGAARS